MQSALLIGLFTLLQFVLVMARNNGVFVYGLDDAYIHLDLADQLWRTGVYGLNANTFSAPSSSILWPLLLTPFAGWDYFVYVPFIFGLIYIMLSAPLLERIIRELGYPKFALAGSLIGLMALNMPGLALIGMEHGLHILVTLAVVLGLLQHFNGKPLPVWFWMAVVYGPLIRYEGVLVSVTALGILFWQGKPRDSLIGALAMLVPLLFFSAFLVTNGQEALPSSTMVKKLRVGDNVTGFWLFWLKSIRPGLTNTASAALVLGAIIAPIAMLFNWRRWRSPTGLVLLGLSGFLVLNLVLARLSGLETPRYSNFALAFALPLTVWLVRSQVKASILLIVLLMVSIPGALASAYGTQPAISAIYLQQYQLYRLTHGYWHDRIAVNDIGLVGYRNPYYVLDLIGLEDANIRRLRTSGQPQWADDLLAERQIKLVAVYRSWFKDDVRKNWTPVGELFRDVKTTKGDRSVLLLTPDAAMADNIRIVLRPWATSLPAGAHYVEYDENNPAPMDDELRRKAR